MDGFCFNYSIEKILFFSFQFFNINSLEFQNNCNKLLIKELFDLFGFFLSTKFNFFIYLGKEMKNYYYINCFSGKI